MTTEPLHVAYERVCEMHPELRLPGFRYDWHSGEDRRMPDDEAAMLIEAACWRMLPQTMWFKIGITFTIRRTTDWSDLGIGPTLAHALLAACEAQETRK